LGYKIHAWFARSTPGGGGGGDVGLEIGFSSSLVSDDTATIVRILTSPRGQEPTSWHRGIPTVWHKAVFSISSSPIIRVRSPIDRHHCGLKKFPVCFLNQKKSTNFCRARSQNHLKVFSYASIFQGCCLRYLIRQCRNTPERQTTVRLYRVINDMLHTAGPGIPVAGSL
jgi:hypothetical protein